MYYNITADLWRILEEIQIENLKGYTIGSEEMYTIYMYNPMWAIDTSHNMAKLSSAISTE